MASKVLDYRIVAGVFSALLIGSPLAAQTEYRGGGFITGFTAPCVADGWSGTVQMVFRARPSGMSGNHPTQNIVNIFIGTFTMHYRFEQDPFGDGEWVTAVNYAGIGGGFGTNPPNMPNLRELPDPVGTVFGSDDAFHTSIEIANFAGVTGCTARLDGWAHRN
jgi:hypothetical protein